MKPGTVNVGTRWLPLVFFAAYIVGVLISPPDAVHGVNHDYHAVFKTCRADSGSMRPLDGRIGHVTVTRLDSGCAASTCRYTGPVPVVVISLRILIETWRLVLWPG